MLKLTAVTSGFLASIRVAQGMANASATFAEFGVPPAALPPEEPRKRKYEYGFVKKTVMQVLRDNPGEDWRRIQSIGHTTTGVTIDEGTLKNTLKDMLKNKQARSSDGRYFLEDA